MGFNNIYKHKSAGTKTVILLLLMFVSVILHSALGVALVGFFVDNGMNLVQHQDLTNQASVNYLKLMQIFSGVGLFITPILVYAYLTGFEFKFVKIGRQAITLLFAIMMLITPFIALLLEWNMKIPFPDWLLQFDINSDAIIQAFLKMDTIWDLVYTIIVIAVIPAVGEELFFRGYLQQKTNDWLNNPHVSILITAFLFSIIHFHFQGLIPRFFLGVLLGYLCFWSQSLWPPILAHFINNAQAVVLSFPLFNPTSGIYSNSVDNKPNLFLGVCSFFAVTLLLYLFYQSMKIRHDAS